MKIMLHNQTQMAEAEYAFLTGLTGFGEIQTQSEALPGKGISSTT
jgi:hypothetical protein